MHVRRGAMANPLFRHERCAQSPPLVHAEPSRPNAVNQDGFVAWCRPFSGYQIEQFPLSIAGHAGDDPERNKTLGDVREGAEQYREEMSVLARKSAYSASMYSIRTLRFSSARSTRNGV